MKPETRVAICVERGLEMMVGLLGMLKAGGAYVPLDPNYPEERLSYMVEDSAPVGAVDARASDGGKLGDTGGRSCRSLAWEDQPESNPDGGAWGSTPEHLAYVIYTSGSTGKPKGSGIVRS